MTKDQLYKELNYVNHSREKRLYYANLVLDDTRLISPLLEVLFRVDDHISCRAAWVFEYMCGRQLAVIIPYLDIFTKNVSKIHLDSAVRPVAKVCEYVVTAYYSKERNPIQNYLTEKHKERIIETCFDWMINDEKVAPKAYAMSTLFLLGEDYDWIHPELALILERDFATQSAAFKARARHILKKIRKNA